MRSRLLLPSLIALAVAPGGCGKVTLDSPDAGQQGDAGPRADSMGPSLCTGDVALENAWQCTIDTVCTLVDECFGESFTFDDCLQLDLQLFDISARYGDVLIEGSVAAGTMEYDGQELGRCLDAIGALTCDALFSSEDPFEACAPFIGTLAPGEACVLDLECAIPGARCDQPNCTGDDICCFGACTDVAPRGGTCDGSSVPCEPGNYCVNGTCEDGAPGSRCTGDWECDDLAFCNGQTCQADYAQGDSCTNDDQCPAPTTCVGENLPGINPTCERSSLTGDPCDGSCASFASHYCDRVDLQGLGTCQPRLREGEDCAPELMPCEIGMRCDAATLTCVRYGEPGATCQGSTDCSFFTGTFCSNEIDNAPEGVCLNRQPDGSSCSNDSHCESAICNAQGVCATPQACY